MKFIFVITILTSITSHARVFSITESGFATYFKGSYGLSATGKDAYQKSSGASTTFDDEAKYNWGGELGFMFPSKDYAFRLGLEIISPSVASGIKGMNGATEYMSLDSSVTGFFPVGHFEYYVSKGPAGRVIISVGGGYGKVSMTNDYTMTVAGTGAYTVSSFKEKASQYAYLLETAVGYEMSFAQTTTVCFDLGYRYSVASELKYDSDGVDLLSGNSHSAGDPVLNSDGKHKTLDLGGVFAGLSFRFYFN